MEQPSVDTPRVATAPEAATVARLLDTFNRDYDTPTPGTAVLATRLGRLLAGGDVIALLTGDPAVAVALLTLRPNVWYDGPVALPDELYVAPELRGRGLGSALLTTAGAVIRQRGGELLEINVSRIRCAVRVETEQHAAVQRKHDMVEVAAVLIENWVDIEEPAIPFAAGPKVGHGHGDVGDRGEVGHRSDSCSLRGQHRGQLSVPLTCEIPEVSRGQCRRHRLLTARHTTVARTRRDSGATPLLNRTVGLVLVGLRRWLRDLLLPQRPAPRRVNAPAPRRVAGAPRR